MKELDRITVDPDICLGQPTIRGMRITVSIILKQIASGMTTQEILEAYEGGFGWLIVECDDDEYDVFGAHVPEVRFEKNVNEKDIRGSTEIRVENVKDIKYDI